jgi:hypothetical protein
LVVTSAQLAALIVALASVAFAAFVADALAPIVDGGDWLST